MYKFQGFNPGDIIRARDFEDRPGRGPTFVEGIVDMVCPEGSDRYPYAHYKLIPLRRVWDGTQQRDAAIEPREIVIVPMEIAYSDYDNRIELVTPAP
jgi:hypothetical protein